MPNFDIEFHGLPFHITDVEDEDAAHSLLLEAVQADGSFLQSEATALGMDFDIESQTARERSTINKFLIGAGKSVQDTIDMVHVALLEQSGADFQALLALDEKIKADQESFDQLADQPGIAADVGEVVGTAAQFAGTGGVVLVRGLFGMARFLSPMRWFAKAGKRVMSQFSKKGVDGRVMQSALQSTKGQNVVKAMQKADKPSSKTTQQWADTLAKEGGAKPFAAGSNKAVRDAQVKIAKASRAQTPKATVSSSNVAAQSQTATGATAAAAGQRATQSAARSGAQGASRQAGRSAVKDSKARVRKEIAELVRRQATGR